MRKTSLLPIIIFLASLPAVGHHAPAIFDQSRTIVIEGTVTEFVWSNPHSWIHMDVVGEDGKVLWKAGKASVTYQSPMRATVEGRRMVVSARTAK